MNKNVRKAVIAGNWKMNKTRPEAKALLEELKAASVEHGFDFSIEQSDSQTTIIDILLAYVLPFILIYPSTHSSPIGSNRLFTLTPRATAIFSMVSSLAFPYMARLREEASIPMAKARSLSCILRSRQMRFIFSAKIFSMINLILGKDSIELLYIPNIFNKN